MLLVPLTLGYLVPQPLKAAEFRHPADRQSADALTSLLGPAVPLIRAAYGNVVDEVAFLENLATGVKVDENQLPELQSSLVRACGVLDLAVPDLYVRQAAMPNAYTLAVQGRRPFVVVTTALLDLLTPEEVEAVLAHELGHLKCEHGIAVALGGILSAAASGLDRAVGTSVAGSLRSRLLGWQRAAELSCDRAALLVARDATVVQSVMMKLAGGSASTAQSLNVDAYLRQADAYDAAARDSRVGAAAGRSQVAEATHPLPIFRARELERWASSAQFSRLVASRDRALAAAEGGR